MNTTAVTTAQWNQEDTTVSSDILVIIFKWKELQINKTIFVTQWKNSIYVRIRVYSLNDMALVNSNICFIGPLASGKA